MTYRLGVDVGGTFTDLLLFDDGDGRSWRFKTSASSAEIPAPSPSPAPPLARTPAA